MEKKLKMSLIFMFLFGILGYGIGFAVNYVSSKNVTASLTSNMALIFLGVCAACGFIFGLFTKSKEVKSKNQGTTTEGEKIDIAFDSKFISPDEMRTDKDLIYATWNTLPETKKTGFVFRMKKVGSKFEVNMKPETHALVLGTTGTGKTQLLANPTIRILSHSGQKPSLVMTDPKG